MSAFSIPLRRRHSICAASAGPERPVVAPFANAGDRDCAAPSILAHSPRLKHLDLVTPEHPLSVRQASPPRLNPARADAMVMQALHLARTRHDQGLARAILASRPCANMYLDGDPLICHVAENGYLELVRVLVEQGASLDSHRRGAPYRTPLLEAAAHGHTHVVQYLLGMGANPAPPNTSGFTALMFAAEGRHGDIVDLLATEINVNDVDFSKKSVLMYAVQGGDAQIIGRLFALGARHDLQQDDGMTALLDAAKSKKISSTVIVRILLAAGADANHCSHDGKSALIHACIHGTRPVVELLLGAGADINKADTAGRTPLMHVCLRQLTDTPEAIPLAEFLVERGADRSNVITDSKIADFLREQPADVSIIELPGSLDGNEPGELMVRLGQNTISAAQYLRQMVERTDEITLPPGLGRRDRNLPTWFRQQNWLRSTQTNLERLVGELVHLRVTQKALAGPGEEATLAQKIALHASIISKLGFSASPYSGAGFSKAVEDRLNQHFETEKAMLMHIAEYGDAPLREKIASCFEDCLRVCPSPTLPNISALKSMLQNEAGLIAPLAEMLANSWTLALAKHDIQTENRAAAFARDAQMAAALRRSFVESFAHLLPRQDLFTDSRAARTLAEQKMPNSLKLGKIDHVTYENLMVRQIQFLKEYFAALAQLE